jgi:hypothetical protein
MRSGADVDILKLAHFTVVTPATDLTLLTPEELRIAAGLDRADASQDETLAEYETEVAAEIASDCAIASDGVNPPTLRSEVVNDVFRYCSSGALWLSRKHVSDVSQILENGIELTPADWLLEAETGKLMRLADNAKIRWSGTIVEVFYTAGFDIVPNELKAEAKSRIKFKASEGSRDPLARSIRTDIPDVESRQVDYQVGGLSRLMGEGLAPESERRLRRFMTQSMVG